MSTPQKKERVVAVLLALFLGGLGIHKFYLGRNAAGVMYLLFFWTFIPALLALLDIIVIVFNSQEEFDRLYNAA